MKQFLFEMTTWSLSTWIIFILIILVIIFTIWAMLNVRVDENNNYLVKGMKIEKKKKRK